LKGRYKARLPASPAPEQLRPQDSPKEPKRGQVRIRKALARDKAPILEITRNIWGGHDYLPQVWDDWLADEKGRLIVATVNGRTVGVAHASLQTPDVAWLEGVRVHEHYRGSGIAGKLNKSLVEWARKKHARVARLCTGSRNHASQKHLKKIGFPGLQTFQRLDMTRGLNVKPAGITTPKRSAKSLWHWLIARPEFIENRAMYSDGWTWYPLTQRALRKHIAQGHVLTTPRKGQPSSCCILHDEDKAMTMGFVAGDRTDISRLVRMLRFMMLRKKRQTLRVLLPSRSSLIRALERSGFGKTAKILVYEKFLG
jgi:N-acetylglutamate synthase-like GNAT family acetyltransferase